MTACTDLQDRIARALSATGAVINIEGCKTINMSGLFTGGTPTTNPVYTLMVSNDLTNWQSTSAVFTVNAAGLFTAFLSNSCWRYAQIKVTTASSGGSAFGCTWTELYGTN